eukprot:904174-Prorocentrum_lima.AAC.1
MHTSWSPRQRRRRQGLYKTCLSRPIAAIFRSHAAQVSTPGTGFVVPSSAIAMPMQRVKT